MNVTTPQYPIPAPPRFDDPAEDREHKKTRLVAAFRVFSDFGLDEGIMGHISFRDPEEPGHLWMNPFAMNFALIRKRDLLRIDWGGRVIEGHGTPHPAGLPLHAKLYQVRPEVNAIAHSHSMYGKIWSTTGRLLDPISTESGLFHRRHIVYDTFEEGEGEALGMALDDKRAIIMKNHGILTVGDTVDEAAYSFISLERACKAQILAEATRTGPVSLEDGHADRLSKRYSPVNAWLNFQPLFDRVLHDQPEIAE